MAYKTKYSDDEVYRLKENEFPLQFICNDKNVMQEVQNAFNQCGLEIRRRRIVIKMRLYNKTNTTFQKRQLLKIVSIDEIEKCIELIKGKFSEYDLNPKEYARYKALEKILKTSKQAVKVEAPKNDHFYLDEE